LNDTVNDDLGEFVEPPKLTQVSSKKSTASLCIADSNWKQLLASLTAADMLELKRVSGRAQLIVTDTTSSVSEVLAVLAENTILSVPVVERRDSSVKYIGFVDVLDILVLVVKITDLLEGNLHEFFSNPFFETPILEAIDPTVCQWSPIQETTNLLDTLLAFQKSYGQHRLPITDEEGRAVGVLSQSDMVRLANANILLLGDKVKLTVEELELVHPVIAVRHTAKTIDALRILVENRVHGVAVVEHQTNKLIANLSASDFRGMRRDDLALFDKSVMEFLKSMNSDRGGVKSPVWCPPLTTLSQVIALITSQNVHRVYIADEKQHALGVVSLSDIMRALADC